jgi:hypothetical protein
MSVIHKSDAYDSVSNINDIPNIAKSPLHYVMEDMGLRSTEGGETPLWLEFGVYTGGTINYMSQFAHHVYGFDSFEGLPETWRDGFEKGTFNLQGNMPRVHANVTLTKGWFSDTLPLFLQEHSGDISFIHMDADIYSSTKYVFDIVKDRLAKRSVIVFDELLNYPGFELGELKALDDFLHENPEFKFKWIGMNGSPGLVGKHHEEVAIELFRT